MLKRLGITVGFAFAAMVPAAALLPPLPDPPHLDGAAARDQFGVSIASADLNRDGRADLVVGARDTDPNGVEDAGSVYVYSGRNGSLLKRFDGTVPFGVYGAAVLCRDINRDGWTDLLIGAPNQGRVFVYSGRNWGLLLQLEMQPGAWQSGYSLAAADVNHDRYPDVITGAPNFGFGGDGGGRVTVYSGKNGAVLRVLQGADTDDQFGLSVAAGDVNGDGCADVVAGAPLTDVDGREDAGSVFVYSGKDWTLLRRFDGAAAHDVTGVAVAAADLNNDRRADIVLGAHGADPEGILDAGSVFVYSGRNGAIIRRLNGAAVGDHFGYSIICEPVDRDRTPDIVTGGIQEETPRPNTREKVWIASGRTGRTLQLIDRPATGDLFGLRLAVRRDRRGSASALLVGAPTADPEGKVNAGSVYSFALIRSAVPRKADAQFISREWMRMDAMGTGKGKREHALAPIRASHLSYLDSSGTSRRQRPENGNVLR